MADFDPQKYRVDPSAAASTPKGQSRRRKASFIMFPKLWAEALAPITTSESVYRIALYLLFETWRSGHRVVKLTNAAAAKWGVGRDGKATALRVLRQAGLIAVEERPKKSPLVTVRFTD